jgi:hypothetical protein
MKVQQKDDKFFSNDELSKTISHHHDSISRKIKKTQKQSELEQDKVLDNWHISYFSNIILENG